MSLLDYFQKTYTNSKLKDVCETMKNDSNLPANISADELLKVQESLNVVTGQKSKRVTYSEDDKQEVTKYALLCGASAAVRHFRKKYPHLTESTVRPWVKPSSEINQGAKETQPKSTGSNSENWKA